MFSPASWHEREKEEEQSRRVIKTMAIATGTTNKTITQSPQFEYFKLTSGKAHLSN